MISFILLLYNRRLKFVRSEKMTGRNQLECYYKILSVAGNEMNLH